MSDYALRWLRRSPGVHADCDRVAGRRHRLQHGAVHARRRAAVPAAAGRAVDQLVDVFTTGGDGDQYATSSYPDFQDFKAQNQVFSDMLGYSPSIAARQAAPTARASRWAKTVTGNYFQLLGIHSNT